MASPPPSPPPSPPYARPVPRWGLGDAVAAFVLSLVAGVVASVVAIGLTGTKALPDGSYPETAPIFFAAVVGQYGAWFGCMAFSSIRKGLGSLRADFGLAVDVAADWWLVPVGFCFEKVAEIVLLPITRMLKHTPQNVVEDLQRAHGVKLALFVVTVLVIAPVAEELFFRGLLLRSLLRKMPAAYAVALSALAFGLAHVVVDFGSGAVLPALVALGMISGIFAVRTGKLSRSILLHAGFNLLAVLAVLTNR